MNATMDWTAPAFERLAALLRLRAGLEFGPNRHRDAESGARRAMLRAKIDDPETYLRLLESGKASFDELLAEITVGETYFFREPAHYDFIRREVLRALGPDRVFRAWSAGCSTGEEAYSLAIALEQEGWAGRSRVVATDVSRPALAKARAGVFGQWSLRSSDAAFIGSYFHRTAEGWRLERRLVDRVDFEYLNLALDNYPSLVSGLWGLDLILCRNVLIYFDRETIRAVARRLADTLADGGWLITGPSDPLLSDFAPLEAVMLPEGVFYRRHPRSPRPAPTPQEPGERPLAEAPAALLETSAREEEPAEEDERAACLAVRAAADRRGAREAEQAASRAAARYPASVEANFLWAALLIDLQRDEEAARILRRLLYMDRSAIMAHFMLGCVLRRLGDAPGAARAFRSAQRLGATRPAGETVPLSDNGTIEQLLRAAAAQLELLGELP